MQLEQESTLSALGATTASFVALAKAGKIPKHEAASFFAELYAVVGEISRMESSGFDKAVEIAKTLSDKKK